MNTVLKNEHIKQKDKDLILQALSAGVVPRVGLRHLQVGRVKEVSAIINDIENIINGGSSIRLVIGEYGAGKTFFLNLAKLIAHEKKCVTVNADLSPDRRLYSTNGHARMLYAESIKNMATRSKPDGNALVSILERFIGDCSLETVDKENVEQIINIKLSPLFDYLGGHDFVSIIKTYWKSSLEGNEERKLNSIRWLRGEYSTKTEAKNDLGIRNIIDDSNMYDYLKIMSSFVKIVGYNGFIVIFDEMVNIYKLQNRQTRNQNYEQILKIINDNLQGNSTNIGFLFGGIPEFLTDNRRGCYSYEALQSRLSENVFANNGLIDLSSPVIRLQNLTKEELYVLLLNILKIANSGLDKSILPEEALKPFMEHCFKKIGESYFRTPRNTIRSFVQLLSVILQNENVDWKKLIESSDIKADNYVLKIEEEEDSGNQGEDDLATIRI